MTPKYVYAAYVYAVYGHEHLNHVFLADPRAVVASLLVSPVHQAPPDLTLR